MDSGAEKVFRQVVVQALNDALGYTNEYCPTAHSRLVKEAQDWWMQPSEDFDEVCQMAELDPRAVREMGVRLIQAKVTGDHSRIPEFWRLVFKSRRSPNMTVIEKAIRAVDRSKKPR